MRKREPTDGELPPKTDKPTRAVAIPKPLLKMHDIVIPKDAGDSKQLTDIVRLLKDKNSLASTKEITVIAAKTIKAAEISQKSGSDAFRREATKSLINLRDSVSKSTVLTDKRIKTLLDRFDDVSLDAKNASYYLLETAKIKAVDVSKKAKSDSKDVAEEAKGKSKLIVSAANTTAKNIIDASRIEAIGKSIESNSAIKEKNASAKLSRKNKNDKTDEGIKIRLAETRNTIIIEKEKNRADHLSALEDIKLTKAASLANINTSKLDALKQVKVAKFSAMSDIHIERETNKLEKENQAKKNRDYLEDRKQKQNDNARSRIKKIRDREVEHSIKMKAIEDDAKSDIKLKKISKKEEDKKIQDKKISRDNRSKKFNASVIDGVYDANPLLKAGINIASGLSSGIGRLLDWNKTRKTNKESKSTIIDQLVPTPRENKKHKEIINSNNLQKVNRQGTTILHKGIRRQAAANDEKEDKKKPSFLKQTTNKVFNKKPNLTKTSSGIPSGTGVVGEAADGVGVLGEGVVAAGVEGVAGLAAGAAEVGGALVAGIAALSGIIGPVVAGIAGIAGVIGLASHFFGGSSDDSKSTRDVVGKITPSDNISSPVSAASNKPSQYEKLIEKKTEIETLSDKAEAKDKQAAIVSVTTDNSVRSSNTTITQEKLTTRNDDSIYQRYGYGVVAA